MRTQPVTLLRQAQNGNLSSLGPLLVRYTRYLAFMARTQVGKRLQMKVDSEDLVQETFLEAHRQFPRFRGTTEAEFSAWLRAIMAGRIAMMFRHYRGTQARDIQLERQFRLDADGSHGSFACDRPGSSASPSQQVSKQEQALLLAGALASLSEDYRAVVVLRHLEQLSFSATASRMQRSEDSVQKLGVRALRRLRELLKHLDL